MDSHTSATSARQVAAFASVRPDLHNVDVDDDVAGTGACGQLHLPSGRSCRRQHLHTGPCDFVLPMSSAGPTPE